MYDGLYDIKQRIQLTVNKPINGHILVDHVIKQIVINYRTARKINLSLLK